MQAAVLIAAEKLALAGDALAFRQVYAAVCAAHHVFAPAGARLLPVLNAAAVAPENPENDQDSGDD